jgi:hypothetical protein
MGYIRAFLCIILFETFCLSASSFSLPCPEWMQNQIDHDINHFKKPISLKKLETVFQKKKKKYCLVKFTICGNQISIEHDLDKSDFIHRMHCFEQALTALLHQTDLPNVTLLISMHDAIYKELNMPVCTMAKEVDSHFILLPDFEALNQKYQVLKDKDITQTEFSWEKKKNQMVWRGSSGQRGFDGSMEICAENMEMFSRIKLCQLSKQFPELIDAGFTYIVHVREPQLLMGWKKEYIDYDMQVEYKYHLLVDGNTSAFSNSGWKFFINSAVFIPESTHVQWYFKELIPYVNFIPVAANLNDLVDKIRWAMDHEDKAAEIARNSREFAKTHLTITEHLTYLYYLLLSYSKLKFV